MPFRCARARSKIGGKSFRASSFDSRRSCTGRPGIVAEREAGVDCLQRRGRRRDPVAEAAVDDGLRRPEGRERLAALVQVVELRRMSSVSTPRRRWLGMTPTNVMPAHGAAPPGIVISKAIDAVKPTGTCVVERAEGAVGR